MIILVGASASGKTEIAHDLAKRFGITKAITHTTRKKRTGERNNVDYHFVDVDEFEAIKKEGGFVETTSYNGNYYGCSKKEVADDKCIILDPNGVKNFIALGDGHVIVFFLECPKAVREQRMRGRGDEEEAIQKRLDNDDAIFNPTTLSPLADYTIDTSLNTVTELTDKIHSLYMKCLSH